MLQRIYVRYTSSSHVRHDRRSHLQGVQDSKCVRAAAPPVRLSVIVCAWNEQETLGDCLRSLLEQTRPPDEILVVDNGSTDRTSAVARAVPGVAVIREPRKGLTHARQAGLRGCTGSVVAWLDADCRAPRYWLERVMRRFDDAGVVAVSGPFRYYDWTLSGRTMLRLYDGVAAPLTNWLVRDVLGWGALLYGGNFAVRREAIERIGGFDTSIEFHGEDTNLGRRLHAVGRVVLARECVMSTSARRFRAMGTLAVIRLYTRNFWHELLWHRPADARHQDVRL